MPQPSNPTPPTRPNPSGETLDESGALIDEDDGIPGSEPPPPDDAPTPARRRSDPK